MVTAEQLLRRSSRAVCGTFERELNVDPRNIKAVKLVLRQKGYRIVGTSEENDKIWFVARGAALL